MNHGCIIDDDVYFSSVRYPQVIRQQECVYHEGNYQIYCFGGVVVINYASYRQNTAVKSNSLLSFS